MKIIIVGLTACLLCAVPSIARADTITVTGGEFGTEFSFTSFEFQSDGFLLRTLGPDQRPVFVHDNTVAGTPVDLSMSSTATYCCGSGTIAGVMYPSLVTHADLLFTAVPFAAPRGGLDATTPFSLSGFIQLASAAGDPIMSAALRGSGTAHVTGSLSQHGVGLGFITFNFANTSAAPTPEPSTLFMLAAGLVVLGRRQLKSAGL
jgi:PEP-CTERM motif